jgi:hypothetical protein
MLLGKLSVNAIPDCVIASEAVLVIVQVYLAIPPSVIVVGDSDLVSTGATEQLHLLK